MAKNSTSCRFNKHHPCAIHVTILLLCQVINSAQYTAIKWGIIVSNNALTTRSPEHNLYILPSVNI